MIRILTYNVEFGKDLKSIYKWIESLDKIPDVICFQEFPEAEVKKLPRFKIFKNSRYFFAAGVSSKDIEFGELTIILSPKIKTLGESSIDFGPDKIESIYKRRVIKRSALINTLEFGKKEILISNVHLTPVSLNNKRRKQLLLVLDAVKNSHAIILGDFNYSSIFGSSGLVDLMKRHDFVLAGGRSITNLYKRKIPQQLDYVFYKGLKLKDIEVIPLSYSDHYPVFATFE